MTIYLYAIQIENTENQCCGAGATRSRIILPEFYLYLAEPLENNAETQHC
jgi:hypothetical protein